MRKVRLLKVWSMQLSSNRTIDSLLISISINTIYIYIYHICIYHICIYHIWIYHICIYHICIYHKSYAILIIFDNKQFPVSLIMYCMLSSPTQSLASSSALQPLSASPSAWMWTSQLIQCRGNPKAPKGHVEKTIIRVFFLKLCWSVSGKLVEN